MDGSRAGQREGKSKAIMARNTAWSEMYVSREVLRHIRQRFVFRIAPGTRKRRRGMNRSWHKCDRQSHAPSGPAGFMRDSMLQRVRPIAQITMLSINPGYIGSMPRG